MKILHSRRKRKKEKLLERMIEWVVKKEKTNVLFELLKTNKRGVQIKILEVISRQKRISFETIYDMPDEVAPVLEKNRKLKAQIWSKLSILELSPIRLLNLIKFRCLFREEAINYALKKLKQGSLRDLYAGEIAKEIIIFAQNQQTIEAAVKVIGNLQLSSFELGEIIRKRPEIEEIRRLKRQAEKKEDESFRLVLKIQKVIDKI